MGSLETVVGTLGIQLVSLGSLEVGRVGTGELEQLGLGAWTLEFSWRGTGAVGGKV